MTRKTIAVKLNPDGELYQAIDEHEERGLNISERTRELLRMGVQLEKDSDQQNSTWTSDLTRVDLFAAIGALLLSDVFGTLTAVIAIAVYFAGLYAAHAIDQQRASSSDLPAEGETTST